jgi:ribonuclease-3
MSGGAALEALQRRIGHVFRDPALLKLALTHSSAAPKPGANANNERLEFLGDRVLGLVIAELLVKTFPDAAEGELSRRLATLVRKETCAEVADEIGLGGVLKLGKGKSRLPEVATRSMLSDACEALVAALYLDGGLEPARSFITAHWGSRLHSVAGTHRDAKTTLQEWVQGQGIREPTYAIVEQSGPQHDPRFRVTVVIERYDPGTGEGRTRRDAEQAAARAVLLREGVWKAAASG